MKQALVAVAALAAMAFHGTAAADTNDRRVEVQNHGEQAVYSLFASPVTSEQWEEDLLGDEVLPSGGSITANIDNGTDECRYDIRIVLENGTEHIRRRVDVCTISRLVVDEEGMTAQ